MRVHYCDVCGDEVVSSKLITFTLYEGVGKEYEIEVCGSACAQKVRRAIRDVAPGPGRSKEGRIGS